MVPLQRSSFVLVSAALAPVLGAAPQREAFLEQSVARGLAYVTDESVESYGVGMGFFDLNGDASPDVLLVGASNQAMAVYENDGDGYFTDRSRTSGIPTCPLACGIAAGDYDADGDLDVYVSCDGTPNFLLRNNGALRFTNVAYGAGVDDVGYTHGCAWGDYDSDGWIDLYVANRDADGLVPNRLFHNLGDGTFVDVAPALGVQALADPLTFQSSFFDYDNDGDQDLYLCTDKGEGCVYTQNRLYRNLGGTFEDVTDKSGTEACVGCMGTGIGDFDGNGFFDFYCTNIPLGNVLLMNQGNGTFLERATAAGMRSFRYGWANIMFDYNHDGRLDLYLCNTDGPNRLYEGTTPWPCPDVAPEVAVDDLGFSYTTAIADLEGDGDLDLLLQNYGDAVKLFVNEEGEKHNWLQVRLVGREPNTSAFGAKVRVSAAGVIQMRESRSGVGFKSTSTFALHWGLGSATIVDRIRVDWPYGGHTVLEDVPINRRITIREDTPGTFFEVH